MSSKPYNVLFISRYNSARSIMAEALMNRWGRDRFRAFSAGVEPKSGVHPLALELINRHGLPAKELAPKSWTEFLAPGSDQRDQIDFIIVIRDQSAGEPCPEWPGRPLTACWNVSDPESPGKTDQAHANRFRRVFQELENRIKIMVCLRPDAIDRLSLKHRAENRAEQLESPA